MKRKTLNNKNGPLAFRYFRTLRGYENAAIEAILKASPPRKQNNQFKSKQNKKKVALVSYFCIMLYQLGIF